MEIDLTGKFALVGGSTDGIGKAIATRLAASGASVCIMARNKSKLEKVVNELDTSNEYYYDSTNATYDQVVNFNATKE